MIQEYMNTYSLFFQCVGRWLLLCCMFFALQYSSHAADIRSTTQGGNWDDTNTWIWGVVPNDDDRVFLSSDVTILWDIDFPWEILLSGFTLYVDGQQDIRLWSVNGWNVMSLNSNGDGDLYIFLEPSTTQQQI